MLFRKNLIKFNKTKYFVNLETKKVEMANYNTHQTKREFKQWSKKDLRNELKRFGQYVPEDVDKKELIRKVKDFSSIDVNKRAEKYRRTYSTATMGASGHAGNDYSNWSINDLKDELKRFGQKVTENMKKSELIQKLTDLSIKDSKTNENRSSKDIDFNSWSIEDLRNEMKRLGYTVSGNMMITGDIDKGDLVKKLEDIYKSKDLKSSSSPLSDTLDTKDQRLNMHSNSHIDSAKSKNIDFTNWSITELRDEMRKMGQKVTDDMKSSDMVHKLKHLYKIQTQDPPLDVDYDSWSVDELVRELKKFGHNVSESIEKTVLIQKMKEFYKEKTQPTNSNFDFDNWSISNLKDEMKKIGHEVSENIQQSEMVQKLKEFYKDKIQPTNSNFDFDNWSMSDLKDEMKKIGQEASENIQQSEMVQKLKEFYKDKIQPTTDKMDFENWTVNDLKNEMKKLGHEVSDNMPTSEMIQKLKEWKRSDSKKIDQSSSSHFPKQSSHLSSDRSSQSSTMNSKNSSDSQKDYSNWSISDLRNELKKFGLKVSDNIQKSELIQKLRDMHRNDSNQFQQRRMYSTEGRSELKDYSNWSITELKDELKKFGQKVSDNMQKSEMIQKLRVSSINDSKKTQHDIHSDIHSSSDRTTFAKDTKRSQTDSSKDRSFQASSSSLNFGAEKKY